MARVLVVATVVAGCCAYTVRSREEVRHRISQLEEMETTRFDPPATKAELQAVKEALAEQRNWLKQWHVLPWAPSMPWADLPMDSQHKWLSQ